jgi:hypothetical protein
VSLGYLRFVTPYYPSDDNETRRCKQEANTEPTMLLAVVRGWHGAWLTHDDGRIVSQQQW